MWEEVKIGKLRDLCTGVHKIEFITEKKHKKSFYLLLF